MLITISKYLLIFMPVMLISGPLIPEIFMNFVSLVFLFYLIKNKNFIIYFNNKTVKIILIFYLICILSSLFSEEKLYSLLTSIPYIRYLIFAVAASWIIYNNENVLKKIYYSFIFSYFILILFAIFEFITNYNVIYGKQFRVDRISSLFGDELILGSYLSRFFPILLGLGLFFCSTMTKSRKFLFYLLIFTTPSIVFLSGERTSFFFMIIGFIGFIFFFKATLKIKVGFVFSAIFFIIFLLIFTENVKKNTVERTLKQINPSNNKIHFFSEEHEALASSAIKIFNDNKILGSGPKTFKKKCQESKYIVKNERDIFGCYSHPHNTSLQILSEIGIIGFVIYFIMLFFVLKKLLNIFIEFNFKNNTSFSNIEICCYLSFLITLFPIVPGGNFFNNYLNIIYYYPLGIFLAYKLKNKL